MELLDEGVQAVEINQTYLHLSHPTKFLLSAYVDEKLRHGNNPVLNWMASCLQLQYDHKDNCQPSKPERLKSSKRIDGIAAVGERSGARLGCAGEHDNVYGAAERRLIYYRDTEARVSALERAASEQGHNR